MISILLEVIVGGIASFYAYHFGMNLINKFVTFDHELPIHQKRWISQLIQLVVVVFIILIIVLVNNVIGER